HQALVFARRTVDLQHGQSPVVCSALVDRHFVVVVRQHLPEGGRSYFPLSRLRHGVLEFASDTQFAYRALPVVATCGALVTETSQVWPLVAEEVAIARDIEAVRPAPVVVALLERRLLELARCSKAEVVIHQVVPQFTGAAAQAVRPYIGSGAHQDPRGVQRRSTKENQRCL